MYCFGLLLFLLTYQQTDKTNPPTNPPVGSASTAPVPKNFLKAFGYPKATMISEGFSRDTTQISFVMETSDPIQKVAKFYESNFFSDDKEFTDQLVKSPISGQFDWEDDTTLFYYRNPEQNRYYYSVGYASVAVFVSLHYEGAKTIIFFSKRTGANRK